jgi:hypothetical protein
LICRSLPHRRTLALVATLLPGLLLAGYYDAVAFQLAGRVGFPLDDSWIHAQFARNLATGAGFTYTSGAWVSGSTAPLWTVLLAAAYFLCRNMVVAATLLGLIMQAVTGFYAMRLAGLLGIDRLIAALAGTLAAVTPIMVWGAVSGMEVTLAAALLVAGLFHCFRVTDPARVPALGITLLGLASLARPESMAVVAVVVASEALRAGSVRQRLRRTVLSGVLAAAAVAPLVIFSYATIGRPLPTTFYAKSGPGIVRAVATGDAAMAERAIVTFGPRAVSNFGATLLDQFGVASVLLPLGLLYSLLMPEHRRIGLTMLAIFVLVPFAMGIVAPQRLKPDNVRYTGQLVAAAAPVLIAAVGFARRHRPAVAIAIAALAVAATAARAVSSASLYAISVKNIEELHVVTGQWLRDHVPAGELVAANDVGAIAYFGGRRVLDLEGLVSPDVLPYRGLPERGLQVVLDMRPGYVVIFPAWYPEIPARADLFTEIHRVRILDNVISAGDEMIVFRTPWASGAPGDDPAGTRR